MAKRLTKEEFISRASSVHGSRYDYSKVEIKGYKDKITIVCKEHGEFNTRYDSHFAGCGCPKCAALLMKEKMSRSHDEFIELCKEKHGDTIDFSLAEYKHSHIKVSVRCVKHNHTYMAYPFHLIGGSRGCPFCATESQRTFVKKDETHFRKLLEAKNTDFKYDYNLIDFSKSCMDKQPIICKEHGVFHQSLAHHIYNGYDCPKCVGGGTSKGEREVLEFVKSLGVVCSERYKSDKSIGEIDVFCPNEKVGIEYDGLYWHSEIKKTPADHRNKRIAAENAGIKLIQVFSDEWKTKQAIVKSIISASFGKEQTRIFARKTELRVVSDNEVKPFLENNHIQGHIHADINLALFHNQEMVMVMTFGKQRAIMGKTAGDGVFELYRMATILNTRVVGGASKLLSYFKQNYKYTEIESFCDMRYGTGKVYSALGFEYVSWTPPNYYYVKGEKRYHRAAFMKHKLVEEGYDPNKTESEIMRERGFLKIYDCGSKKFVIR